MHVYLLEHIGGWSPSLHIDMEKPNWGHQRFEIRIPEQSFDLPNPGLQCTSEEGQTESGPETAVVRALHTNVWAQEQTRIGGKS